MIYDRIKSLAKDRGISINKIEQSLNFGTGSISKWNQSSPSVTSIKRVAEFLEIGLSELLDDEVNNDEKKVS